MSGSERRPSAARERILTSADRLFYDEGIHAVGINRIVADAGVTLVTLYRHFPSKDDLIKAYLQRRARADREQVEGRMAALPDDPRRVLSELATALTEDNFAGVRRGCPFINASAEFTGGHPARVEAGEIRAWIVERLEQLLTQLGHRSPRATAQQLMMVRTGAVVSGALDQDDELNAHFLDCWNRLIDDGLPNPA
ncbi:TetR/AcrR family transcriptional regulator [Jatrophihabitans fulvus]